MAECIILSAGVDISPADAAVGEVMDGKFFFSVEEPIKEGTMPTQTLDPASENVPAGYYAATTLSAEDVDLDSENIKATITIFGFLGSIDVRNVSDADALVGEVKDGVTFYAVGGARKTGTLALTGDALVGEVIDGAFFYRDDVTVKLEGTMPIVAIIAASDAYPEGYHAGDVGGLDAIDTNLAPENIKSGVNIFGKVGTYRPWSDYQLGNTFILGINGAMREISPYSTNWTKSADIDFGSSYFPPEIRTTFRLRTTNVAGTAYGQIYRNGGAVGTERSTASTGGVVYDEDIGGWGAGNDLEIWAKNGAGSGWTRIKNFGVKGTGVSLLKMDFKSY